MYQYLILDEGWVVPVVFKENEGMLRPHCEGCCSFECVHCAKAMVDLRFQENFLQMNRDRNRKFEVFLTRRHDDI